MQGIVTPTCLVYVATTFLSPLFNWALIFGLGFGVEGAAISNDLCNLVNCSLLLAYIIYRNRQLQGTGRETWLGW